MHIELSKYSGIAVPIVFALAGLGLFLIAVKLMSSSMKTMSSGVTSHLLKKLSSNQWIGFLFGVAFTTMIQSSDGTVALAIGLIGAGLLTLRGAIPILLGANIGTATTALIVALGQAAGASFEFIQFLPLLVFLGAAILMFVKEEKKMNIAMLVFAIGAIFLGLKVLGAGMHAITAQGWFGSFTKGVGFNPWVAMLANTGFTGVVQSSSATVTVVQSIYTYDGHAESSMSLQSAIGMVIGANIGTTFTALITSIGAPKDAKRIAIIWLFTNSAIALIIMPMINIYASGMEHITPVGNIQGVANEIKAAGVTVDLAKTYQANGLVGKVDEHQFNNWVSTWQHAKTAQGFQLAWAHLIFNCILSAIFIWFVRPLEWMTKKIIKDEKVQPKYEAHLPVKLIKESPDLALDAAVNATNALGRMTEDYIAMCQAYTKEQDKAKYEEMQKLYGLIETTRTTLYAYLVEIGTQNISKRNASRQVSLILVSRSLERIPTLAERVVKNINDSMSKGKADMSIQTSTELQSLFAILLTMTTKAAKQLGRFSQTRDKDIKELNEYVDNITQQFSANYITRGEAHRKFDYIDNLKIIRSIAHQANRVNTYVSRGTNNQLEIKQLSANLEKEIMKGLV